VNQTASLHAHTTVDSIPRSRARGVKVYQLHGPLFFASVTSFNELFHPAEDPDEVAIDFYFSRVYDQSALEAINTLAERYAKLDKRLHLCHLSRECRDLLDRARRFVEVDQSVDPHYHVSIDGFPADSGRKRALKLPQAAAMAGADQR
jgi:MFS superfamily sulfate permease-like transporter